MVRVFRAFLALLILTPSWAQLNVNLTVGYLTAVKGNLKDRQGLTVSGAMTMALEDVNNDPTLLPNVTLQLRWNDTRGEAVATTRAITDMMCSGVAAFFGPEGSCHVAALVAQSRNIPMISYKCSDYRASEVPTFARTEPPNTQVTKSIISLLRYYKWSKFSIIAEETWGPVARSLEEEARKNNMTINHMKSIMDVHKCCVLNAPCCHSGFWYHIIQETKSGTRIYVFLGTPISLIDMMSTMQALQMFEKNEYVVIHVDMMTYSPREAMKYLWKPGTYNEPSSCYNQPGFEKRAKSLLVVVSSPITTDYKQFTERVRNFTETKPFGFITPSVFENVSYMKSVSIYAAYLYDSVMIYSKALHKLIYGDSQNFNNITEEYIREVASNGTKIIETIVESKSYQSITGYRIKLDSNGDPEGNFSVLSYKSFNLKEENFTCNHHLITVGQFQQNSNKTNDGYPFLKMHTSVDWVGGKDRPNDEPSCGFDNSRCAKNSRSSIAAANVLAIVLFCAIVIVMP